MSVSLGSLISQFVLGRTEQLQVQPTVQSFAPPAQVISDISHAPVQPISPPAQSAAPVSSLLHSSFEDSLLHSQTVSGADLHNPSSGFDFHLL
jgi:hypothetical protein